MSVLVMSAVFLAASTGVAFAAPTVSLHVKLGARGKLYEHIFSPVNLSVTGSVKPASSDATVQPLANLTVNFPGDMRFATEGTRACKKDIGQKSAQNANVPPAVVRRRCPYSIVGDGTAIINPFGSATSQIIDPILTVFNAGHDRKGDSMIYIQGYSQQAHQGVLMTGTLKNGKLSTDIPQLAFDSAVTRLNLKIPGDIGQDPTFVRARCPRGQWRFSGIFTLGDFSQVAGKFVNLHRYRAPTSSQPCKGAPGRPHARLGHVRVKGPSRVGLGTRRTFRVTVTNTGSKTAAGVRVEVAGRGVSGGRRIGRLESGRTRTIKVRVGFSKVGTIKVRFKLKARQTGSVGSKVEVRVTRARRAHHGTGHHGHGGSGHRHPSPPVGLG